MRLVEKWLAVVEFITKKRYAMLVFDNEGKREDVDGKAGKIKAMGLDQNVVIRLGCKTFLRTFY